MKNSTSKDRQKQWSHGTHSKEGTLDSMLFQMVSGDSEWQELSCVLLVMGWLAMIPVEIDRLQDERQKQMVASSCFFKVSSQK